jgi:hypothetical protein
MFICGGLAGDCRRYFSFFFRFCFIQETQTFYGKCNILIISDTSNFILQVTYEISMKATQIIHY